MPKRSVITIHWNEAMEEDEACRIAESLAKKVMDRAAVFDSDASATLWEDDD